MIFRLPRHQDFALYAICFACILAISSPSIAEPWIDAGDERARHHLQVLSDAGLINVPLTTWPVMWSSVSSELNSITPSDLRRHELWSYQYLRHELRRAQESVSAGQHVSLSTSRAGISDYGTNSRERFETRSYASYTGNHWTGKLQAFVVVDSIDWERYRADGSYIAGIWGNWALGAGAIDRWWGPGWQSSLILSNNARPSPGFFVTRVDNRASDLPLLEWLGPWDFQIFLNQLENDRATSHAKLFGMRASFKPFEQLEIGLSRTAQWGGEGRPQDAQSFWKMFIGQSNRDDDGIAADGSNEPANQLAGYDWRLGHSIRGVSAAFYGQLIGEDEAGGLPYKFIGMAGVETSFAWGSTHNRFALEASNTTMEFDKGDTHNVAYEHPRYPSGYRYRGRPLGASTDNDSELWVLKGFHSLDRGHQFNWTIGSGTINEDGNNASYSDDDRVYGGNVFGANATDLRYATAEYSLPVTEKSQVSFGGQYYNNTLRLRQETVETSVFITYELRL